MIGRNIAIAAVADFRSAGVRLAGADTLMVDPIGHTSSDHCRSAIGVGRRGDPGFGQHHAPRRGRRSCLQTPGSELIAANCTACHSPEMILVQPALNADRWQATIDKMRGVYKAPIAPADDKALDRRAHGALPSQLKPK